MADLLIQGMHGMGDNLHQRAVVRHHMKSRRVWLETPWPQLYHDLAGPTLRLVRPGTALRTQGKNASMGAALAMYTSVPVPRDVQRLRVWYAPDKVRQCGSVLGAMLQSCAVPQEASDFRMPVPADWKARARQWLDRLKATRPILFYRPLVERTEWKGCHARNPDAYAYGAMAAALAAKFFTLSIADLVPEIEWIAGADIDADAKLHAGELELEALIGMIALSDLVYAAPGFAIVAAQAVGTPSVCVFGGYEDSHSFSLGARLTPHLGIDTIKPCQCFRHEHACEKRIDLRAALARVTEFADDSTSTARAA